MCNVDNDAILISNRPYHFIFNICAIYPTSMFLSATLSVVGNKVLQFHGITDMFAFAGVLASDKLHK